MSYTMRLPTTTTGTTATTTSAAKDDSANDCSKKKDDDNSSDTMVLVETRREKWMTCRRIPDAAMVPVVEKYIEFWFGRGVRQRTGPMNDTPLLEAARHGNIIDVVMVLMHRNVHADTSSTIRTVHEHSSAPLSTSTIPSSSRVKTVQINAKDKLGKTALYVTIERMCRASSNNHGNDHDPEDDLSIVRLLLEEHGANVNVPDHQGKTALHVTAYHGTLLWDGAISSSSSVTTSSSSFLLGPLLMQHGVNVNAQANGGKEGRGHTALHLAALQGHGSTFAWLLQQGADCSIPDHETGCTPLCYLIQFWHSGHERLLHQGLSSFASSSEDGVSSDTPATTMKEDDRSISTASQQRQGQRKSRKNVVDVVNTTDKEGWTMLHHVAKWKISRSHKTTMMPQN
jgi:ankyrin repeat protein